jgi:hypothetical protein
MADEIAHRRWCRAGGGGRSFRFLEQVHGGGVGRAGGRRTPRADHRLLPCAWGGQRQAYDRVAGPALGLAMSPRRSNIADAGSAIAKLRGDAHAVARQSSSRNESSGAMASTLIQCRPGRPTMRRQLVTMLALPAVAGSRCRTCSPLAASSSTTSIFLSATRVRHRAARSLRLQGTSWTPQARRKPASTCCRAAPCCCYAESSQARSRTVMRGVWPGRADAEVGGARVR